MAFSVQEFRSELQLDGARPNLFKCDLNFPLILADAGFASRKLSFMARSASLPGSTVNQIPQFYFGRELKFAGNRTFAEWNITVINDEHFRIRNVFERWLDGLNSHRGNVRRPEFLSGDATGVALGYQVDGFVTQYGKTGPSSPFFKIYNFVGMFPIDLSPIELDWSSNDTIEEFGVTFAYQWWESNTTT